MSAQKVTVSVTSLGLDLKNPRYPEQENSREARHTMLTKNGENVVNLAKDIVKYGLSPIELLIVMRSEESIDEFIVLEGNRRLCALQLLSNPDLIKDDLDLKHYRRRFDALSIEYYEREEMIDNIEVIQVDSREEGRIWIERKHYGYLDGVGTIPWKPEQKDRFIANGGVESLRTQVLDYARSEFKDLTQELSNAKITTIIERIIDDEESRKRLGISKNDSGNLVFLFPEEEVRKPLHYLISDIIKNKRTTRDFWDATIRKKYFDAIPEESTIDESKHLENQVLPKSDTEILEGAESRGGSKENKRTENASYERSKLFTSDDRGYKKSKNAKLIQIGDELTKLNIHGHRASCAIIYRTYVEIVIDYAVEYFDIDQRHTGEKLHSRIKEVRNRLSTAIKLAEPGADLDKELIGINQLILGSGTISAPFLMNQAVHRRDWLPLPSDLCHLHDNLRPFFNRLFSFPIFNTDQHKDGDSTKRHTKGK